MLGLKKGVRREYTSFWGKVLNTSAVYLFKSENMSTRSTLKTSKVKNLKTSFWSRFGRLSSHFWSLMAHIGRHQRPKMRDQATKKYSCAISDQKCEQLNDLKIFVLLGCIPPKRFSKNLKSFIPYIS